MAVVGFDFGSQNCFISVARGGGIETIINDYSLRYTPSYVSFSSKKRLIGVSSKNQSLINYRNTIFDFKNFLARKFPDSFVEEELKSYLIPFEVIKGDDNSVVFKVEYADDKKTFTPEQIASMLFTKLKHIAETQLNMKVYDCVISCPGYFTDAQRRSILVAAQIADLNCLRLCDDLMSSALAFCVYKGNDLPIYKADVALPESKTNVENSKSGDNSNDKLNMDAANMKDDGMTENQIDESKVEETDTKNEESLNNGSIDEKGGKVIAIIDFGHQALQASLFRMYKNKIKAMSTIYEPFLGGRNFDMALYNHFIREFTEKYKLPPKIDVRAQIRLLEESAKVKKLMSANSTPIPIGIESFTREDLDVSASIKREDFEKITEPLLVRIQNALKQLIKESKMDVKDIDRIEIVGGSSRMPAFKSIIKHVFGKEPQLSLNTDEAVSNGCAIQCAILSPTFKVRDVTMANVQSYPLSLIWKASGKDDGYLEIFPQYQEIPYSKIVSFYKEDAFSIEARYSLPNSIPFNDPIIGVFNILLPKGQSAKKVKVKVRIDANGLFKVISSQAITLPQNNDITNAQSNLESKKEDNEPNKTVEVGNTNSEVKKIKPTEIPIESHFRYSVSQNQLNAYKECEAEMCANDSAECARENALNALEECVYETRDNLSTSWEPFAVDKEKEQVTELLNLTSQWLDDEGYEAKKHMYVDKLEQIKKCTEPIVKRYKNYNNAIDAFTRMQNCVNHVNDTAKQLYAQLNSFKMLANYKADFDKVDDGLKKVKEWYEQNHNKFIQCNKHKDMELTSDKINLEIQKLEKESFPILQKLNQAVQDLQNPPKKSSKENKDTPEDSNNVNNVDKTSKEGTAKKDASNMDIDE